MKDQIKTVSLKTKMVTMSLFFFLWACVLAVVDVFAWENGATATISQCWLEINRRFWPATYIVALWMGVLLQHVSIARDPGTPNDVPFSVPQMLLWTLAFWAGMYIGWKWLYQLPHMD